MSFPLGFFAGTELDFGLYWFLPIYAAFAILFYWIDASAGAARRSDPLLRDTLHWTKVRLWLWTLNAAIIALYISVALYYQAVGFNPKTAPPVLVLIVYTLAIIVTVFVPLISGALLLAIGALRSGDTALRGHLQWFGVFALFMLIATLASTESYPEHHSGIGLLTYAGLFVGGYFLYRSARSLVPLNRL